MIKELWNALDTTTRELMSVFFGFTFLIVVTLAAVVTGTLIYQHLTPKKEICTNQVSQGEYE